MIKKVDKELIEDIYNLTPLQEGILFHYLKEKRSSEYFEQLCLEISASIDWHCFIRSWEYVVQCNENLRTVFRWSGLKQPVQIVLKRQKPDIAFHDFCREESQAVNVQRLKEDDLKSGFDLTEIPFRINLCKLAADRYLIIMSSHHIIFDGWSNGIILREFMTAYEKYAAGAVLPILPKKKYKDYLKYLYAQDKARQKDYWNHYLAGYTVKAFPVFNPSGRFPDKKFIDHAFALPEEITARLSALRAKEKISTATILYYCWGVLLQKYTNSPDVVFGTTVSGRNVESVNFENVVGLFINTLPLRLTDDGSCTLKILNNLGAQIRGREQYEHSALPEIKAAVCENREELFDTLMVIENYPLDSVLDDNALFRLNNYSMVEETHYDLTVKIKCFAAIEVEIAYNSSAFTADFIERLGGHFRHILQKVVSDPGTDIPGIKLLTPGEERQILKDFNNTRADYERGTLIHRLFEKQAAGTPDSVALQFNGRTMTYKELNARANQLAGVLHRKGAGPDTIVALITERSFEMMIAVFAVLKAGGAYLPVDPEYPDSRIQFMLNDSGCRLVLAQSRFVHRVKVDGELLDLGDESLYRGYEDNLPGFNQPDHLAYVIYTSGSTGNPKGVMIEHHSVINRINWMQKRYQLNREDVLIQKTPCTFDVSVWEIFWWSFYGARLVLLPPHDHKDPDKIIKAIDKDRVTTIHFVPSMFNIFLDYLEQKNLVHKIKSLKRIFTSGEALTKEQVKKCNGLLSNSKTALVNLYGPTEATVDVTFFDEWPAAEPAVVPIGKPIDNTQMYVVNKNMDLTPVGIPGELCISGVGLARGYLNREELTRARFVDNPFIPGQKLYKTGDSARWLPDGNLEFLGRIDNQVKIRGFRIEPGEIEARLLKHAAIRQVAVLAGKDAALLDYLCAYYVSDEPLTSSELMSFLDTQLPDYMIPAYFVHLQALPLSPNGKLDRKALPEPDKSIRLLTGYKAPTDEREEKLAAIWQSVLETAERIGIHDNFFERGGHSLKATRLSALLCREFNVEAGPEHIFRFPTIEGQAGWIKTAVVKEAAQIKPAEPKENYRASAAQTRMYILNQFENAGISYNMTAVFELKGRLDLQKLERVFRKLIERHEIFRTSFVERDGQIFQQITDHVDFKLEYAVMNQKHDLDVLVERFVMPFKLNRPPLLRVMHVSGAEFVSYLVIDIHHIISDGASIGILMNEFSKLYDDHPLETQAVQYKDFCEWQNGNLNPEESEKYWLKRLGGEIPVLTLPCDFARPAQLSFKGDSIDFSIDGPDRLKIREFCKEHDCTVFMFLLSVFNVLLKKYSRNDDILVGSPIAGRTRDELKNLVGLFVNTIVFRNRPSAEKSFLQFLREVKTSAVEAYAHQEYPFEILIKNLAVPRDQGRNPLFDVMFVMNNAGLEEITLNDLKAIPLKRSNKTAKFDLTITAVEEEHGIGLNFEYCTDLFSRATIEQFAQHFVDIAKKVPSRPQLLIRDITMPTGQELETLVYGFNRHTTGVIPEITIQELFEKQAALTPDSLAVSENGRTLSYLELNARANQLAHYLIAGGITGDSRVGLMLERSLELIVAILAILKTGASYIPIDPDYPENRIDYILRVSEANIVITGKSYRARLSSVKEPLLVDEWQAQAESGINPGIAYSPESPAYTIFTSGSTGRPKGVVIKQSSLVNYIVWAARTYTGNKKAKFPLYSSIAFDLTVTSIFTPLITGGEIHIYNEQDNELPVQKVFRDNKVDIIKLTPAHLKAVKYLDNGNSNIKKLIVGGELLETKLADAIVENFNHDVEIYNEYGPTEATVGCMIYRHVPGAYSTVSVPIGKPIDNLMIYLLDDNLSPVPRGVAGEIYIGGAGVAAGYLKNEELNREKFIPSPFCPGDKLYKTGDLARMLPDYNMEFIGRCDRQVKIRGFRIELQEIERKLADYTGIRDAIVIDRPDRHDEKYLCAYYLARAPIAMFSLREYLCKSLPDYMIPAFFVHLDQFPLTNNGKIDLKALPDPGAVIHREMAYTAPADEVEAKLVKIWQQVLSLEQDIGVNDDFFQLGGHSLSILALSKAVNAEFALALPFSEFFKNNTIGKLAARVRSADDGYAPIQPAPEADHYPLSDVQKRFYLLTKMHGGSLLYNTPVVIKMTGKVNIEKVEQALHEIIRSHEIFRVVFTEKEGKIYQQVNNIHSFNISRHQAPAGRQEMHRMILHLIRPFDINREVIRCSIIRAGAEEYLLVLDMHHIVSDGVSVRILMQDFIDLFRGKPLNPGRLQYKDYVAWLNTEYNREKMQTNLDYWVRKLKGMAPFTLRNRLLRPEASGILGNKFVFDIEAELTAAINQFLSDENVTLYTFLLTAFMVLLSKLAGAGEVIVGSPVACRTHPDTIDIAGPFVNTVIFRETVNPEMQFRELLTLVQADVLAALENQEYNYSELTAQVGTGDAPLFNIMFSMEEFDLPALDLPGLNISEYDFDLNISKFELTLNAKKMEEKIRMSFEYAHTVFNAETITGFSEFFRDILQSILLNPQAGLKTMKLNHRFKTAEVADFSPEAGFNF